MRRCACLYEGASLQQAADAGWLHRGALVSVLRDLRAGRLTVFTPPGIPAASAPPPFLVVIMRVSGSRRMMGGYLNGNAAWLPGWLSALMAAAAIALFAAGGISPLPSGRSPGGA